MFIFQLRLRLFPLCSGLKEGTTISFALWVMVLFCHFGKGLRPLNSAITVQLSLVKAHSKEHFLCNVVINVTSVWDLRMDPELCLLVKQGIIRVGLWAHPSQDIVTGEGEARGWFASSGSERYLEKEGLLANHPSSCCLWILAQSERIVLYPLSNDACSPEK